ncbi:hypothetical protein B0J14DRAFT_673703 [Halenospora varia]|nr:hypothetical protein B0J14DRAFT_673703 [Halenospora varia]
MYTGDPELGEGAGHQDLPRHGIMKDVGTHYFAKQPEEATFSYRNPVTNSTIHLTGADAINSWPWHVQHWLLSRKDWVHLLLLAPIFEQYIAEFNRTLQDVIQFAGVAILVLRFRNFIWVPIQTCFGRRVVLITSIAICLGSSIWRAKAKTYPSFMGACVYSNQQSTIRPDSADRDTIGLAETAQPAIIADIIFLHDRGKHQTLYFTVYFGVNHGICIGNSLPSRNTPIQTRSGQSYPVLWPTITDGEAFGGSTRRFSLLLCSAVYSVFYKQDSIALMSQHIVQSYEPRPQKTLWTPVYLLSFPIVLFASCVVSWSASSFLTLNLTQGQVFAASPYKFTPQQIGFTNFAILGEEFWD